MDLPDHWPPAAEPADMKLAQLCAINDQLASDVPLVEHVDREPAAQSCATCRTVATVRDRARALRDWPQYRKAVEALHAHRRATHPQGGADRRALVLTGQHTVRTTDGTVLRFFLASAAARAEADAGPSDPACGWEHATDFEFQRAYEDAQFDPQALASGELRPNVHRRQLPLDALAGPGGFFWSDGADEAGIMTTNGLAPGECGLSHLTDLPRSIGGAS
ncbi:hypothetical protein [Streptomyces zagrosensis]|uniref:Uncharacterized protein n=1 Tax=Streptomyces zagrosensis TaxID=1042984 RepID=A0A7W9V221_9ACTN|nr:hypothetical protein [Streptomyces zagrosensis]MBB5939888.1 hypothetical protein [Streptomyces zagrosensis]